MRPSEKQLDTFASVYTRFWAHTLPPVSPANARAHAADATAEEVSSAIDSMNAKIGFDKHTTPATARQMNFIGDLEVRVYGKARRGTRLTYADADERIRFLKSEVAAPKQPSNTDASVIDLFTRRVI